MELSLNLIWPLVAGVFGAGSAWGITTMTGRTTARKVHQLEREQKEQDKALAARIDALSAEMNAHKTDTTDRLARIETKVDLMLSRVGLVSNV